MNTPSQSRLVRSACLGGYIGLVRGLGRDPLAHLRQVGLSAKLLEDPETLIPVDAVRELLERTAKVTGVEDLALRLAAERRLADLGPISLVIKEEATAFDALNTLCRYLKLLNSSMIMRIEEAGATMIVREDLLPGRQVAMRQSVELAIGAMHLILRELIGPKWQPLQVCFTHRAPQSPAAHRAFFGKAVSFNQEFNGIVCDARDLTAPRKAENPAMARFARSYLDKELKRRNPGHGDACHDLVLALLPGGRCTADQVAQHLRVDRRTLHRQLASEGLTFSAVLDQVRTILVIRHLRDSDLPLGEVSGLLGFASPSGLSHWFRKTFGCSITQWRQMHAGETAPNALPLG